LAGPIRRLLPTLHKLIRLDQTVNPGPGKPSPLGFPAGSEGQPPTR
jgi:hypothetical protein